MLYSKRFSLPTDQSAVDLTAGFDTDQDYTLVLRRTIGNITVGTATVVAGNGYNLDSANSSITMRILGGKVYATGDSSGAMVDVLAYSS